MINKLNKLLPILFLYTLIIGCSVSTYNTKGFPDELMIGIHDLPKNFNISDSSFPEIEGGYSCEIKYENTLGGVGALIMHQITIYPDSKTSSENFSKWEKKWLNEKWVKAPETTFVPKNSSDLFRLACLQVTINDLPSKSCRFIQLHNNLIILVLTNIQPDNLNFQQFDEILKKIDNRLPGDEIPMPGE